jgi:DNA-binding transcriptional regulator YiaG
MTTPTITPPTNPINRYPISPIEKWALKNYPTNVLGAEAHVTYMSQEIGITYHSLHRLFLGTYNKVPARILDFLVTQGDIPDFSEVRSVYLNEKGEPSPLPHEVMPKNRLDKRALWELSYELWVKFRVRTIAEDIQEERIDADAFFVPANMLDKNYKSFRQWRESLSYSQMDFCKTFFIHQAILYKYESGQMKNLPESIRDRVLEIVTFLYGSSAANAYVYALSQLPVDSKQRF